MPKRTYQALQKRVEELEKLNGALIEKCAIGKRDEVLELSILFNISQALASTRDLDQVLAIVIDAVNKALLTEGAGALLYDENRGDLYWREVKDARKIPAPQPADLRLPLRGSIAGWVFQNNKPARVNDTSKDPRFCSEVTKMGSFEIRKVLTVPLNTRGKTVGVLVAVNKISGDFSEHDEALMESMAGSIALAIENATAYEKLQKFKDALEMIYRSSMALAATVDLDHLLEVLIADLRGAMEIEAAGVVLYDEQRGDLYWREVQDDKGLIQPDATHLRLPLDGSISGQVFQTGEPVLLNNPTADPKFFKSFASGTKFALRNMIIVPLNTKEKTIGALLGFNKMSGDFSEQDEALLGSMGGSIALAIENATAYDKLQKSKDALEMIYRSSMALATTVDLDHLLEVLIADLRGAMEIGAAGVVLYDEQRGDLYWREVQDDKGLIHPESTDLRLPLDGSISGQVFQTGEPVLLNNPTADPKFFKPFVSRTRFAVRNMIIVPLNTRDKTIGALLAFNKKGGQFTENDVHLLSSLAGVVAISVENTTFFQEMLKAFRKLEEQNLAKSKILHHLSHELVTPLSVLRGTLHTMAKRLKQTGTREFDQALERMNRQIQSLHRLESQVESIMRTGYSWERRQVTGFLKAALDLMEVQTEYTPEIERAATILATGLERTFPTRRDELERIKIKEFGRKVLGQVRAKAKQVGRTLTLKFFLRGNTAELLIPSHVLQAVIEGLAKNAIEATPDHGSVRVTGVVRGDRYVLKVKDTGIGIPDKDKELIFQGFYPVQDMDTYATRQPYAFNAGGKGIDLLRIRMWSELYGFNLSFTSHRCPQIAVAGEAWSGDQDFCERCEAQEQCAGTGGSEFVVDFPLTDSPRDLGL